MSPVKRKAELVMLIVPLCDEVVSVAVHWSPVKTDVLLPVSPVKSSDQIVVWPLACVESNKKSPANNGIKMIRRTKRAERIMPSMADNLVSVRVSFTLP